VVVGGGNSGFQESIFLKRYARNLTIVEFLPEVKASKVLQEKIAEDPTVRVVTNHAVQSFEGARGKLSEIKVLDRATGATESWRADGVFIFIGLSPNSDYLPPQVERDRFGFVVTDATLKTTMPGVFAAGDVRAGSTKQAAAAAGEGATAALMIREYLQEH
jgi:thioredoxin reductase (NADPH)